MSDQLTQAEANTVMTELLREEEFDVEKLWGESISAGRWHPRIRNISTMAERTKLHECWKCGHKVTRDCYVKNFHLAYCTAIVRNNKGVLDFCGEYVSVQSPEGCALHKFSGGHNKDYQTALKVGTSNIPQPTIPTEQEYDIMCRMDLITVSQLRARERLIQQQTVGETKEENLDEEDPTPWTKFAQNTFKSKGPGREKTKTTQGKKLQPGKKRN